MIALPRAMGEVLLAVAVAAALASAAAAWLSRRGLRSAPDAVRYRCALAGIVTLLLLPGLAAALVCGPRAESVDLVRVSFETWDALTAAPPEEPETPSPAALDVVGLALAAVWAVGICVPLTRLAGDLLRARRLAKSPMRQANVWPEATLAEWAKRTGLRRFPPVFLSPTAPTPLALGLMRPRIVLPEAALAEWTAEQQEAVLLHEATHVARRDGWAVLAQRTAAALYWWCPATRTLGRQLDEWRERICDEAALAGACDRFAYVELLVRTAERLLQSRAAAAVSVGLLESARVGLEGRIARLLEGEVRPMRGSSLFGRFVPAALVGTACVAVLATNAFSGGAALAPTKKVQIRVVIDGVELDPSDPALQALVESARKRAAAKDEAVKKLDAAAKQVEIKRVWKPLVAELDMDVLIVNADPRIEELAKKADAIKPGSGAEIRKLLAPQSGWIDLSSHATKPQEPNLLTPEERAKALLKAVEGQLGRTPQGLPTGQPRVVTLDGKQIVVILDGKGQIQDLRMGPAVAPLGPAGTPGTPSLPRVAVVPAQPSPLVPNQEPARAILPPRVAPAASATDLSVAAMQRQLEKLSAEVNELRKRLDAPKK